MVREVTSAALKRACFEVQLPVPATFQLASVSSDVCPLFWKAGDRRLVFRRYDPNAAGPRRRLSRAGVEAMPAVCIVGLST